MVKLGKMATRYDFRIYKRNHKQISKEMVEQMVYAIEYIIKKEGTCMSVSELKEHMKDTRIKRLSDEFLLSIVQYSDSLSVTFDGKIGLKNWSWAFPQKRRDYVEMVLRLSGKPLHYVDITKIINNIISPDQIRSFSEKGVLN